jgi:hypothetical protein
MPQHNYVFRRERWAMMWLGRLLGSEATNARRQARETDRAWDYFLNDGPMPFMHESKRSFMKQLKAHAPAPIRWIPLFRA